MQCSGVLTMDYRSKLSLVVLCLGFAVTLTAGSCAFPSSLTNGVWISAEKGGLTIAGTSIMNYPMDITGVTTFHFDCIDQSGTTFLFQAQEFQNIFGAITRFFLCLDIHEVNSNVFKYFLGTDLDPFVSDYVFPFAVSIATLAQACNRATPYASHSYIPLIKNGSITDGSAPIKCPDGVLAVFDDVTIDSETCANNVLDVCSNRTQMNFTLPTPCATKQTFATDGQYTCLHYITSGLTTYLSVWNNDASPTYQFSCFAYQKDGDTVTATETAKYCTDSTTHETPGTQNSVAGKTIVATTPSQLCVTLGGGQGSTAEDTTTINASGFYAFLIIPAYIFLSLLLILILCLCAKCCKKSKKISEKPRPESPIVVISKPSESNNLRFGMRGELYMKRGNTDMSIFRAKRSLVIPNHATLFPCVLPLPRVEPIYKDPFLLGDLAPSPKPMEQRKMLKPPPSPGIGSLYSFDAVEDLMGR